MADIFQEEIDSPDEKASDHPDPPQILVEEPGDEEEDKPTSTVIKELEVLEIDNVYYFQQQAEPTLEELATSVYIHNRQVAAKKILECLQKAEYDQDELQSVISIMCKLSEDEESMVRCELVQHIPSIALFCHEAGLQLVIQQQLVPYTVKLLNDPQIGVRKLAQSALLHLLGNNLIAELQLSEWICPLIAQLATCESNMEEQRIEDVTVMSMMIPLVDKSIVLKFFLEPYITLCCDPAFGIRTVCAMRFGSLCKIAGTETTELSLLPSFLNLCCDDLWGVRKACADVFVDVANVVTLKTRKEVLPHIFINLLNDTSRFVENAALQSLGGFISSFADPSKTGCTYEHGIVVFDESFDTKTTSTTSKNNINANPGAPDSTLNAIPDAIFNAIQVPVNSTNLNVAQNPDIILDAIGNSSGDRRGIDSNASEVSYFELDFELDGAPVPDIGGSLILLDDPPTPVTSTQDLDTNFNTSTTNDHTSEDNSQNDCLNNNDDNTDNGFNTFQYWRHPIPDLDPDLDVVERETGTHRIILSEWFSSESNGLKKHWAKSNEKEANLQLGKRVVRRRGYSTRNFKEMDIERDHIRKTTVLNFNNMSTLSKGLVEINDMPPKSWSSVTAPEEEMSLTVDDQDIVPPRLLSKYTSMVEYYNTDKAIESCAYSFPAVALTLGRRYWPCIRDTCKRIAADVKWSVRLPIASSLHVLAWILGAEITSRDLLPIFLEYMGDADEVKMSMLQHMHHFLEQLSSEKRSCFLDSIKDFTRYHRFRNWRFRCALAEQFQPVSLLYTTAEVSEHFLPIALELLKDHVFTVRVKATELIAHIIKRMHGSEADEQCEALLSDLAASYCNGTKWISRQTYVFVCEQLARQQSLHPEEYATKILPNLRHLATDPVPNVRLAVARCIVHTIYVLGMFDETGQVERTQLSHIVELLKEDVDADVRQIANPLNHYKGGPEM